MVLRKVSQKYIKGARPDSALLLTTPLLLMKTNVRFEK